VYFHVPDVCVPNMKASAATFLPQAWVRPFKHLGSESSGMSHCVHGAGSNVVLNPRCACIRADALKFFLLRKTHDAMNDEMAIPPSSRRLDVVRALMLLTHERASPTVRTACQRQ
jgi:hypothetical protein